MAFTSGQMSESIYCYWFAIAISLLAFVLILDWRFFLNCSFSKYWQNPESTGKCDTLHSNLRYSVNNTPLFWEIKYGPKICGWHRYVIGATIPCQARLGITKVKFTSTNLHVNTFSRYAGAFYLWKSEGNEAITSTSKVASIFGVLENHSKTSFTWCLWKLKEKCPQCQWAKSGSSKPFSIRFLGNFEVVRKTSLIIAFSCSSWGWKYQ